MGKKWTFSVSLMTGLLSLFGSRGTLGVAHQNDAGFETAATAEELISALQRPLKHCTNAGSGREESITFQNGPATLAGTLALPPGNGPYPGIALISGDGQQDRDWTFGKLKMAKCISDRLVARNVAVLRFDDRGEGGSSGTRELDASFQDRCGDARAALRLLRSRSEIGKAGLCGHSGGAIIAGMTAAQDPGGVDFLIVISGPFVAGEEVLLDQARTMPRIYRAAPDQPDAEATLAGERIIRQAAEFVRTGKGLDNVKDAWNSILIEQFRAMPKARMEDYIRRFGSEERLREVVLGERLEEYTTPLQRDFMVHDPADDIRKVICPLLVLFGGKDGHVRVGMHRPPLVRALADGKCDDFTIRVVPEADHAYTTGPLYEKGELLPGFVEAIAAWILERCVPE
jgi:pimeloyl-ACP methyl ester carboxylesterase